MLIDHFRKQAAYCKAMAAREPRDELKADWLSLAGLWLEMVSRPPAQTQEESFHCAAESKSTGQEVSTSSH
jgi:hypothetical protein